MEDIKKEFEGKNEVIIPFIKGDGTGKEVIPAAIKVINKAVEKAYEGKRKIMWFELFLGKQAYKEYNTYIPDETIQSIKKFKVCLKGPVKTPQELKKSINVILRQKLNLFTSIRPAIWYGQGTPVRSPELIDYIIFRENTDDLYLGIEFKNDTDENLNLLNFLRNSLNVPAKDLPSDSSLGIKPFSKHKAERHIKTTFRKAILLNRNTITVVHRGNILKVTEGNFVKVVYSIAKEPEFRDLIITEEELVSNYGNNFEKAKEKGYRIVLKDRNITTVLSHLIFKVEEYDVILAQNLNGDYITHSIASLLGGVQFIPVANLGDEVAIFEPLHGVGEKIAGRNIANPTGAILAGKMLLEHIGWSEGAKLITKALKQTYADWVGTYDMIKLWSSMAIPGKKLDTQGFTDEVIKNMT